MGPIINTGFITCLLSALLSSCAGRLRRTTRRCWHRGGEWLPMDGECDKPMRRFATETASTSTSPPTAGTGEFNGQSPDTLSGQWTTTVPEGLRRKPKLQGGGIGIVWHVLWAIPSSLDTCAPTSKPRRHELGETCAAAPAALLPAALRGQRPSPCWSLVTCPASQHPNSVRLGPPTTQSPNWPNPTQQARQGRSADGGRIARRHL